MSRDSNQTRRHGRSPEAGLTALLLLLVVLAACTPGEPRPDVSGGRLDLSSRDVEGHGPFHLSGEWAFALEGPVAPGVPPTIPQDTDFLRLPGLWRGQTARGTPLAAQGQGVYRLRLSGAPGQPLSLLVTSPLSVCQIWADGALLAASGVPGGDALSERPGGLFVIADLPAAIPDGETDILIRVTNHHNAEGGLPGNVILGTRAQLDRLMTVRRVAGAFMAGTLLALFLFHGTLYVARRKEVSSLYFSLFCLLWCMATLFNPSTGYVIDAIALNITWAWYVKLTVLPYGMTIPLLLYFYTSLYKKPYARKVNGFFLLLGLVYMLVVLFSGPSGYGLVPMSYYFITRAAFLYLLGNLTLDVVRREKDVRFLLPGFLALIFVEFDDFLYDMGLIGSADFGPLGVFLFVVSSSLFMAARLSRAYSMAEENLELKQEIDMRRATEQRLRSLQRRLSGVLDTLDAPLAAVNPSREICFCNQALATLLGRPVRSLPGQPLRNILAAPRSPGARSLLDAAGAWASPPGQALGFEGVELQGVGGTVGVSLDATVLEVEEEPLLLLVVRKAGETGAGGTALTSVASLLREVETNRNRLSRLEELLQDEAAADSAGASAAQGDITALKRLLDLVGRHLAGGGDANRRCEAVRLMNLALHCWTACTGSTKADLAQQSRIWNVYMEKDGYCRTQTLDKYLSEKTLPSRPRWPDILATAEFVLANCDPASPACAELARHVTRFRSLS